MKLFKVLFVYLFIVSNQSFAQSNADGITALEYDQFKKSIDIFYGLLKANSGNAETYYYLGNAYYGIEKYDSARTLYQKGIALFPQNPLNYIGLGKLQLDDKNPFESKVNFDKALALSQPKDSKLHGLVAEAFINSKNKDIPKAYEMLNKAISIDSKNAENYILLGDAFLSDNNGGMAVTNYEKALELNPKFAKAHSRIGLVYTRSRNFEGSEKAFQDALAINPKYAPAYRDQAELYWTFRKYEKAKEAYESYLQNADSTISSLTRYAYILFMNKDYAKEIDVINQLMAMDSTNIILNRLQAYSLYEQKKYAEGLMNMEVFFKKADKSRIIPQDYEYYGKLLGKAPRDTVNKTNYDSLAILNLQKAMELDSGKTELYADMGDVYMRSKNYQMAQQAYQKKIDNSKTSLAIDFFSLGKSFYFNKEFGKSDTAFMRVIEIKPTASAGYLWRARSNSLNEMANEDSTFALFTKYLEIAVPDPKSPKNEIAEAYRFLGYYYIKKEDNAAAKENYNKSLEFDPENKDAKDILKQLSQQK